MSGGRAAETSHGAVIGRVPGHGLRSEGAPHDDQGAPILLGIYLHRGGEGRAKCSCGVLSEPLPSSYARKRWHWSHKQAVVDAAKEAK